MPECGLKLPCSSTCSDPECSNAGAAFLIVNKHGTAIVGNGFTGVLGGVDPAVFPQGTGVQGSSVGGIGVLGTSSTSDGVNGTSGDGVGVRGSSVTDAAIEGRIEATGNAIAGRFLTLNPESDRPALSVSTAGTGDGIVATAQGGAGVLSFSDSSAVAAFGQHTGVFGVGNEFGATFIGAVEIFGSLHATTKDFVIDHPLDPANRYLVHTSVESSEMANVYSGNVQLDDKGEAWVELPEWLEALNFDFRHQLTCIGQFAPVYVAEEVTNNRFKIAGGKAGMKVSWHLTGIRRDAWAQAHPLVVDKAKPANERGFYRHPEVYNEGEDRAVSRARYGDVMRKAVRKVP